MCGITGYIGEKDAAPVLLQALKRMEYRGYDSAGISTIHKDNVTIKKDIGRIDAINEKIELGKAKGKIGVAHTRWATHGGVTKENAHPHLSCKQKIVLVHNGIIENYRQLFKELSDNHEIKSETDSEVISHLIEEEYNKEKDPLKTLQNVSKKLNGSFALVVIFSDKKDEIYGVRKYAPLIVGIGEQENFISSDIVSFIDYTDNVIFLEDKEIVRVTSNSIEIINFDGDKISRDKTHVAWEAADVSKEEFSHHTIKEIHEQSSTVQNALNQDDEEFEGFVKELTSGKNIFITGSGSSFHIALIFRKMLTKFIDSPVQAFLSSESEEYIESMNDNAILIPISQSGETADLLEVIRNVKDKRVTVLSIYNTVGSSLSRVSDFSLNLNCGPEIGVAATKSFTSQLAIVYKIIFKLGNVKNGNEQIIELSNKIKDILSKEKTLQEIIELLNESNDVYFLGRAIHHPIALEGALKLKELAYIHAEGMAAGEIKHGTLALVEEGTPAIIINPKDESYNDTINNATEMKARGAKIIGVSSEDNEVYDYWIEIPKVENMLYPLIELVPLQLLAYYTAIRRKNNPDYPRNLAKSVTVK
ncbi:MAG: glutamine--fructose-6-phosphate transaminase (isomerizing) [Nitrososphaerales archaeon]|nr:glutamine--fructose-6-phosphate transaminase (isomerizing) [Nitrososphaerales archaeon]